MRGLLFALDADRLLRTGAQAPTADQLADVDTTTRARTLGLDSALARLGALVHPETATTQSGAASTGA